ALRARGPRSRRCAPASAGPAPAAARRRLFFVLRNAECRVRIHDHRPPTADCRLLIADWCLMTNKRALLCLFLILTMAVQARATVLVPADLGELSRDALAIARGRVTAIDAQ